MASIKIPAFVKTEKGALEVFRSQYLHELFWVDLIKLKIAKFLFHIEHRTSEIIIEIPKLDIYIERSGVDSEDVLGWVMSESKLELQGAVLAITQGYPIEDRYRDITDETFGENYLSLLAHLSEDSDIMDYDPKKRWGVTLKEDAEEILVRHAYEYFEASEWESGIAILHPTFQQKHSWAKLDDDGKDEIVEYLLWASKFKPAKKYINDVAHDFLTCIALHPKTNARTLKEIKSVPDSQLQQVLNLRMKKA